MPCALIDDGVAYYQLLRFCSMSRFTYTLRTSFPQLSVRSAKALDGHCLEAWRTYVGWGRSAEAPNATAEEVTSWLRLGFFGDMDEGWYGMTSLELATEAAYHNASVRFIAWLAGPKGPAVRQAIDEVFLPTQSSAPSLDALTCAHDQLLQDGAQDGGAALAAPAAGVVSGPTLVPLRRDPGEGPPERGLVSGRGEGLGPFRLAGRALQAVPQEPRARHPPRLPPPPTGEGARAD